jgi:hypothetical protein
MAHRPGSCCIAVLDGQALDFISKTVQRSPKRRALSVLSTQRLETGLRGAVRKTGVCHPARQERDLSSRTPHCEDRQRWPGCPISLERHGLSGRETGWPIGLRRFWDSRDLTQLREGHQQNAVPIGPGRTSKYRTLSARLEARCITKRSLLVALVSGNKSVHYPQRRCGEVGLKVGLSAAILDDHIHYIRHDAHHAQYISAHGLKHWRFSLTKT